MKGNDAIVRGALLAGCRLYFGYPITPASEIAEAAAIYFPKVGGTFLQAESEVAAINMVYGSACGGVRAMTASSSPGISLKQEGISYAAGAELPCVIVDITRFTVVTAQRSQILHCGWIRPQRRMITHRWCKQAATDCLTQVINAVCGVITRAIHTQTGGQAFHRRGETERVLVQMSLSVQRHGVGIDNTSSHCSAPIGPLI